ncbi:Zinc finger protein 124 [Frankliniella fusca]|uniref:Zinc finger protein 124 n=1 Tax=Frankliniella fusca TaxID=407009 RepID=A0AAE1LFC1_9NEOP|nr:Zinc finger protein 124 [Frankliniella fusca]
MRLPFVVQSFITTIGVVAIIAYGPQLISNSPPVREKSPSSLLHQHDSRKNIYCMALSVLTICLLLLRANIEPNPGPFPCRLCSVVPETIASSIRHQRFHARNRSYLYYCPSEDCLFRTSSFASLNFHVSVQHRETRHIDPVTTEKIFCNITVNSVNCDFTSTSLWEYVQHLCQHLNNGIRIRCPISGCPFPSEFAKQANFRSYLSQYHKKWRDEGCSIAKECLRSIPEHILDAPLNDSSADTVFNLNEESATDYQSNICCDLLDDQLILYSIAKFYLHMYAENLLPQETIQEICDSLSFLTEVVHSRIKLIVTRELQSLDIPQDKSHLLCLKILNADLLYSSHHKTSSSGPKFSSHYLRKQYFKDHFGFEEPKQINLEPDDPDSKNTLQYVSISQSLSKLLENPSIQQEVNASFDKRHEDTDEIRDYTDGTLFRSENHPAKEIHINLYQDSFNPVMNALGSAKNKYKDLVVYFTIANLRPHLRSLIDTKQLVLICRESVFKLFGAKKCLEELILELKQLESEGIFYKGEWVKVIVQFMLGDNLGQHCIGGFVENFSSSYMCRFCEITKEEFRLNPSLTKPSRTIEDYERNVEWADLSKKSVRGIKANCELNCLQYFHAVSNLPVCIAHDLMEGVVSWDLSGIIARFVCMKWFSYDLLNRRIENFKCLGIDSRNKPALVNKTGERLGGHAVQNWMMLRLLYFLVGDKIKDFNDPGWILYLQLKELCEVFCAPSFKTTQVPYIKDVLIPTYFEMRRSVLSQEEYKLKPKHHYMAHYPELMLKYGPLIHLWTMPFEQKHKFFKELLRKTRNFINPEKSCGVRQQMKFCYITSGTLFDFGFIETKPVPLSPQSYKGELAIFISSLNLKNSFESSKVLSCGVTYKKEDTIILSSSGNCIGIGIIKVITSRDDTLNLIIEQRQATFLPDKGIYKIDLDSQGKFNVISPNLLRYPVPHPVYQCQGMSCLSLKHSIIED